MNNALKNNALKPSSSTSAFSSDAVSKQSGYNIAVVRVAQRKQYFKLGLVFTILISLVAGSIFYGLEFLASIPIERSQMKLGYFDRVRHGFHLSWMAFKSSVNSNSISAADTKLPVIRLNIRGDYLDKLNSKLPESGHQYFSGAIQLDGKEYKAKLRYRGDSLNHWAFPQKSWRVKLTKGKFYKGIQYFNLYQPRTQNRISEQLAYEMLERLDGVLTPRTFYAHFRLNRGFNGIRMFLEQVNQNFLAIRDRLPGDILIGDISSEEIYGIPVSERKRLFGPEDGKNWVTVGVHVDQGSADAKKVSHPKLDRLLHLLNEESTPQELQIKLPELVDLESTLRFMAALEIMGSVHIDGTHNQKWYLDPSSGTLSPIAWDALAYLWGNRYDIDLDPNLLFRKLLTVPAFRARKNKIMWDAIQGPLHEDELQEYIAETADLMRVDELNNPFKIRATRTRIDYNSNEDWEEGVRNLMAVTTARNEKIRSLLSRTAVTASISNQDHQTTNLSIEINSHAGAVVNAATFSIDPDVARGQPITVTIERDGLKTEPVQLKLSADKLNDSQIVIPLGDELQAQRVMRSGRGRIMAVPTLFNYRITASVPFKELIKVEVENPLTLTKQAAQLGRLNSKAARGDWPVQPLEVITLEGSVQLTEDLLVHRGQKLVIAPGTSIELAPRKSILVNGAAVEALGTPEKPITIQRIHQADNPAKSQPWGTFGVVRSPLVKMTNVIFKGGSARSHAQTYFPGALSLHHSKVELNHVRLLDGELSLQYSFGSAKHIGVDTPSGKPVIQHGSGVIFNPQPQLVANHPHKVEMLAQKAIGTAPREEREFKFSLDPINPNAAPTSLGMVTTTLEESLAEATADTKNWQALKYGLEDRYRFSVSTEATVYRDIYFDTPDQACYQNDISYRLRHRFSNLEDHNSHLRFPEKPRFWPYRLEFQAKADRISEAPGLSTIKEARLEFRQQSNPFNAEDNLPPPPPWHLSEFIPWMQSGTFKGQVGTPAKHVLSHLTQIFPGRNQFTFDPRVVVISQRARAHLLLKTPWGTGPNPDQAFIITLDSADVYPVDEYLGFLKSAPYQTKKAKLERIGNLLEMEIEFERNVSEGVATLGASAEAKQAFLADQTHLVRILKDHLKQHNLNLEPMSKSKYLQAIDVLQTRNQ